MTTSDGIVEIHEFDFNPDPKRFRIAPDVFFAAPDLPAAAYTVALQISEAKNEIPSLIKLLFDFLDAVLDDESAQLIRARFNSKTNTIGFGTIMKVVNWLIEEYGLRPTQPS